MPRLTCVYRNQAIIVVYVDDLPIFAKNDKFLKEIVVLIEFIYEVKILSLISMLLGVIFKMEDKEIVNINCEHYIKKVSDFTNVSLPGYNPVSPTEDEFPEHLPFQNFLECLQIHCS